MDNLNRRLRSSLPAAPSVNDISSPRRARKGPGLIAALRAAAGLDKPARDTFAPLEGRQLLSAASITGAVAGQNVNDSATVNPFAAIVVTDSDSDVLNVEVQLDNSARGVFTPGSLADSGFISEGSGRYTFFGTPTEATTSLRALIFNPADNRVPVAFSETTRFTISVDDATDVTTNNTTTVRSLSTNDAASMGGFSTYSINDTATTSPFASVTLTDPDPFQTLSLVITVDSASKGVFTSASLITAGFSAAGGGIYTASARVATLQTAIRALVYNPTDNRAAVASTEVTTFTVQLTDNVAAPIQDNSTTVTSTSVNDAPTITGESAGQTVLDDATVSPFTSVTIADVDPSSTLSITVSLDTAAKGAFTNLSLTASGFVSAGGGAYTFSGSAAAATTAIRALVFAPTVNRVLVGLTETTTFTIAANDSNTTTSGTSTTVVASPNNDISSITGASVGQNVNDNATVSPFTGVTISDADSPDQTLTLTVAIGNYTYGLFTPSSVTSAGMSYSGAGIYTRTGTASALTTAVQALVFAPVENIIAINSTETATFAIVINDGLLGPVSDTSTTAIISPINDALIIGGASAGQTTNDDTNITPFAAITFSDVDLPGQTFTATISLDTAAKGAFTAASLTSTGFSSAGAGSYTRTGTPSQLQTAIRALVYNPTDNRVALVSTETTTFTISMADGLLSAVTNTTTTVISTSVNVAPSIGGVSAGQAVLDNATVSPFTNVTIADVDGDSLDITVSIDNAAKGTFTSASLLASGFIDATGGDYTYTGTAANSTTAIRALVFQPTVNRSAVGLSETSTFTLFADDTIANATSNNTTTVISSAYNDASTLGGASAAQAVNDNATLSPFSAFTIADVDSPAQTLTLTITPDTAAKGTFTAGSLTTASIIDNNDGTYSRTGTASQLQTAIRALVFQPTANRVAVGAIETTTLSVSVSDGILAPVTNDVTTIVSTSINTAPTVSGSASLSGNDTASPVAIFSAVTIGDLDVSESLSLSVTLSPLGHGDFTSASVVAAGFTNGGGGVYTKSGTSAALTTAIRALEFAPTANTDNVGNSLAINFSVAVTDGSSVTTTDTDYSYLATSVNDAPTISGTLASQTVNDNATMSPFAAVTIADVDYGSQTQSVTVTVADTAKGTFTSGSVTSAGFTNGGSGVFTFSGSASAATTAIRALVFQPTANRVAVGSTETSYFTIATNDGVASTVSDSSTSVISTSINNAPTVSGASAGQAVNDNATVSPFSGITIADVDPSTTLSLTVTVDTAAKGIFTTSSLTTAGFTTSGGGEYTKSGTASALTTAIRALVFDPTNDRVAVASTETSTFTLVVTDNSAGTVNNATTTVISTAANDAPTISGTVAGQAVNDNANLSPFAAITIGDADSTQSLSITITLDAAAKGIFTSASLTSSGFISAGGGVYTFTGTATQATTAIRQLAFNPTNDRVNVGLTESTTFTLAVDDSVATVANDTATTVVSTSINDAPTIAGTQAAQAVNDNATLSPFAAVTIADVDPDNQSLSISIARSDVNNGVFTSGSLTTAGFSLSGNNYVRTGTAAALTTAIRDLVFQPAANRVAVASTETTTFTINVSDGLLSASPDATTTVVSTSINNATTITGTVAGQAVNDNATSSPFSSITVADVDPNTVTTIVIYGDYAKGGFTNASLSASGFAIANFDNWTLFNVTPAQATTALRALVYQPTANRVNVGSTETHAFTVRADNGTPVDDTTTTVIQTSVNDAPTVTGATTAGPVNDNATILPFTAMTIADADAGSQTQTISVTISDTAHGTFTSGSITAAGFTNAGSGVFTFSGTASAATTAIRLLSFQPVANRITQGTTEETGFTVSVTDSASANTTNALTHVVTTPINDLASISGTSSNQPVNDVSELFPFASVTINDADGATQSLTLSITLDAAAKGVFTSASLTSAGFTNAGSGVYTRTGNASALTTAIQALVFDPANNRVNPTLTETSTFTLAVSDAIVGFNISDADTTVVSTSINDAPGLSNAIASQAVNDNSTISPFAAFNITDPDTAQPLTVTVAASAAQNGTFTSESLTSSGFVQFSSTAYAFTGTAAAAQAAIRQLAFSPTVNAVAVGSTQTTSFTVTVSDGIASDATDSDNSVVSTSINDDPTIGNASSSQAVNDNATVAPFESLTIADVDLNQAVTVTVTPDAIGKGTFTSSSLSASGFTAAGNAFTFTGTAAAAQTAIRQLTFDPTNNRTAVGATETTTFNIDVTDASSASVSNATTTVVSTSINDAPVLSTGVGSQAINDNQTINPFTAFTITDADPDQALSVVVDVSDATHGYFTTSSTNASGFSRVADTLYIFFGTASQAQAAIRLLDFSPYNNSFAVGNTQSSTFTVGVADFFADPVYDAATGVVVTSINDAPTIGDAVASQAVNDNATLAPFASLTIADVDPDQAVTVTVTPDAIAKGTFTSESVSVSGFTASDTDWTFTGTASQAQTAIRQLIFNPTNNRTAVGATETTTFNINVTDASLASVSNTTTTVVSTSINDAPTIGGASSSQAVNDNATLAPFASLTIADVDPDQNVAVTITIDSAAKGAFTSQSLSASGFFANSGTYAFIGTPSAAQTAIRQLVFNPTDNRVAVGNTETAVFTVNVLDASEGSASNNTTSVVSTSINNSPTLGGAVASQAIADTGTLTPFTSLTIADVDPNQTVTVTVTPNAIANGTFTSSSLSASGFTASGNAFTFTGTAAAAQTAIRQLTFNPSDNRVAANTTETTTFTVNVTDASLATASNSATTVVSFSVNDAPVIAGFSTGGSIGDNEATSPFSNVTISDVDVSDSVSLFVTQWSAATGSFTSASLNAAGFVQVSQGQFRFSGTAAEGQNALRQLVFSPAQNRMSVGSTEFSTFSVNVYDASGAAAGDLASLSSISVNDAPTASGFATSTATTDNTTSQPFSSVTIADVDLNQPVIIYVSQWDTSNGAFTTSSLTNSGFTAVASGVYAYTGTPTAATAAIRALTYSPATNRVAVGSTQTSTFSVTVYDAAGVATGGTASTIVTSVNDAPTLSGAALGVATTDVSSVSPFANVTISDVDPSQSQTLFVSEWNVAAGGFTTASLAATGFQTVSPGVHRASGTATAITTAMRGLVYTPVLNAVAVGQSQTATFSFTTYDSSGASAGGLSSVVFTSVNDSPILTGAAAIGTVDDTSTAAPFSQVTITDADPATAIQARVTVDVAAKGIFTASSLQTSGFTSSIAGTYDYTGTPAQVTAALRALQFSPTLNRLVGGQTESVGFTLQISDGIAAAQTNTASSLTARGVNERPTVAAVAASLATVRTGQTFSVTATNVNDIDGTVTSVQFWRDTNGSGGIDDADQLLGTDTSSVGGWTLNTSAASGWGLGTNTIFARAIDSDGEGSATPASTNVTTTANAGALVATLASNVSSAASRQAITLTASGISASSGAIRNVIFYQDTNRNGAWDAADRKLVTDTNATGGYTANVIIQPTWAVGTQFFFAKATDTAGLGSDAALAFNITPNSAPTANGIGLSTSTLPSNNRVTLTLNGGADSDGNIASVEYFADVNGNGTFDSADRKISTSTNLASGFSSSVTLNRAWINNGSIRLFAKAIDNNGLAGSIITTTIAAA